MQGSGPGPSALWGQERKARWACLSPTAPLRLAAQASLGGAEERGDFPSLAGWALGSLGLWGTRQPWLFWGGSWDPCHG